MRLLHTSTIELHEFSSDSIPNYAILSHTWGNDEFLFSDFQKGKSAKPDPSHKVTRCCELAASEGWQYVWIDTCCIDKSSSSELNESINSMFKWYRDSAICYAYLSDFSLKYRHSNAFEDSRWFKRGWTLQELLAPNNVVFFDEQWVEIGSKAFLEERLSQICKISKTHLKDPMSASIAARMSWAACRETSREEDLAYSLLGLFGIHMPLIYGEGANAFRRLQLEIIASSDDESIFAWRDPQLAYSGLLARHPAAFELSGDILPIVFSALRRPPYHMSNKGLSIDLKSRNKNEHDKHVMYCPLNCTRSTDKHSPIVLALQTFSAGQRASRVKPNAVQSFSGSHKWTDLNDVHLLISETYKMYPDSLVPTEKARNWRPTGIRLLTSSLTLENMIWLEGITSDGSFAAASSPSTFVPVISDAPPPFGRTMYVSIQSPSCLEAVLWWECWGYRCDENRLSLVDVFLYSPATGEELVIKAANFHSCPGKLVYCRDLRSGVVRTPEAMRLGANCNASIARTDGTFLWLRTRQECICDYREYEDDWRMVIDVSITAFDHSKI